MTAPRVTLAVPTIGRLEYFDALRRSIEAQTHSDFRVLVLDNASPDEARAKFADWARADSRVRVERVTPRISMFANFDRARTLADGEYLGFCHDDDEYLPRYVEASVAALDAAPRAGFSGSNNDFIDGSDRTTEERRWIRQTAPMPGRDFIRFVMSRGRNLVAMQGIFYRRARIGPRGFDDALSCHFGDYVVLMRIAEANDVALIAEPLVRVRRHEGQTSASMAMSAGIELRVALMRGYIEEFRERHPFDRAFASRLERDLERSVRVGSLWGWLTAKDAREAEACRSALGERGLDARVRTLLGAVERLGLTPALRRSVLVPVVRRVTNALAL